MLSDGQGQPLYVPAAPNRMRLCEAEKEGTTEQGNVKRNPHAEELLDQHDPAIASSSHHGEIRCYEISFAVNDLVAVLGTATLSDVGGVAVLCLNSEPCQ